MGPFTFDLPSIAQDNGARGIDSFVREFRCGTMLIGFDYGQYSDAFDRWSSVTRSEIVTIDGRTGRIGTLTRTFEGEYLTYIVFRDVHPPKYYGTHPHRTHLTISAGCKVPEDIPTAHQIFRSVHFKSPPD
jgi:hypothetical protein